MEVYVADLISVLNALDQGELGPFGDLAATADVSRIGIYGHSTGGGAAVEVCLIDERCDAVLGLDPWVEPIPDRDDCGFGHPARPLHEIGRMAGHRERCRAPGNRRAQCRTSPIGSGVEGANHNDFTIAPLLSPVTEQIGLTGSIPAGRVIPIVDRYLLGFFDVYLLETGSAALDTASFDEVTVEVIRPD